MHWGRHTPPGQIPPPVYSNMHWGRHPPPPTATAMDGTHPTGMHSCFFYLFWLFFDLFRFRFHFRVIVVLLVVNEVEHFLHRFRFCCAELGSETEILVVLFERLPDVLKTFLENRL